MCVCVYARAWVRVRVCMRVHGCVYVCVRVRVRARVLIMCAESLSWPPSQLELYTRPTTHTRTHTHTPRARAHTHSGVVTDIRKETEKSLIVSRKGRGLGLD